MLKELILSGYQFENDYSCSEAILYGANKVYDLGLDKNALQVAAGFGGGMAIGDSCGAVTGSIMVIGVLFNDTVAHQSPMVKQMTMRFLDEFKDKYNQIDCDYLKENYYIDGAGRKCTNIIAHAAEILDKIYLEEYKGLKSE